MNENTRAKALKALEGMREIVRREMLVKGDYVSNEVFDQRLLESGAICGGRKHCAIGSLWVGAGVKHKLLLYYGPWVFLPGVDESERPDFLRNRPGLRVAYNALNDAAEQYMQRHDLPWSFGTAFDAAIEELFEGRYGDTLTKRDLLGIIASAKRQIKAA